MKHIKKFNESNLSDGDIKKITEEIESVSFILQDEGIYPTITPYQRSQFSTIYTGKEVIRISLNTNKTGFVWDSIVNNDEYMEYIDRIKEICESNGGFKIYVLHLNVPNRIYHNDNQSPQRINPRSSCLKYNLCRMVLSKEYPTSEVFSSTNTGGSIFVPIDEAIEELTKVPLTKQVEKPSLIKKFKNLFK